MALPDRTAAAEDGVVTSIAIEASAVELRLAALSDPVRLAVVGLLAGGERCVCDLQSGVSVAPNLLSYHLRVLREAGLVTATRRGRWVDYRLDRDGFSALWASLAKARVPMPQAVAGDENDLPPGVGGRCDEAGTGCRRGVGGRAMAG
jgi:ArsR family transcriptional regulator